MAAHAHRRVISTSSRRRLHQLGVTCQVLRHFTTPWAESFLDSLEAELKSAYPECEVVRPIMVSRYAGRVQQSTLRREAPTFTPSTPAVVSTQFISVPDMLQHSSSVYDKQLASYQGLIDAQNASLANLRGVLDKLGERHASGSEEPSETVASSAVDNASATPSGIDELWDEIDVIKHGMDTVKAQIDDLSCRFDGKLREQAATFSQFVSDTAACRPARADRWLEGQSCGAGGRTSRLWPLGSLCSLPGPRYCQC
eukprot:7620110-Pyramimonas_sp.AAC.1